MTDQPFTTYAFEASKGAYVSSDSPVPRTTPIRLNDIINVKDWGALGNGVHDDTENIKNAIRFANTRGQPANNVCGATVFFPAGIYNIGTPPLYLQQPGTNSSAITFLGAGRDVSILRGNYNPGGQQEQVNNGFLVQIEVADQTYHGPLGGGDAVCGMRDLTIHNQSTGDTSGAVINMGSGNNRYFDNCHFIGVTGFACTERSFGVSVRNSISTCSRPITAANEPAATRSPYYTPTKFQAPSGGVGRITGGVGFYLAAGPNTNLHSVGFDIGFSLIGSGSVMNGCRATQCGIGVTTGIRNGSFSPVEVGGEGGVRPGEFYFLNSGQIISCTFDRCTWGIHAYLPRAVFAANSVIGTTGPNIPATISGVAYSPGAGIVTAATTLDHNIPSGSIIRISPASLTDDPDGFVQVTTVGSGLSSKQFLYLKATAPIFTPGSTWNYTLECGINSISAGGCLFAANSLEASVSLASFIAGGSQNNEQNVVWATKGKYGWGLPAPNFDPYSAACWDFQMCGGGGPASLVRTGSGQVRFPGIPNIYWLPGHQANTSGYAIEGSEINITRGATGLTWGDPVLVFLDTSLAAVPTDSSLTFASVPPSVIAGMDVNMYAGPNLNFGVVSGPPSSTQVFLSGTIGVSLPAGTRINFHRLGSKNYKIRYDGIAWKVVG